MSSSGFLARALEGLAHLGLIEHHEGGFVLTEDGRLMLPGAIGGFGDMASLWHDLFDGAWAEFETTMRTGRPGFTVRYGETIFARLGRDAVAAQQFMGAMRGLSQLIAKEASISIAKRVRTLGHTSICDVGGGSGYLISEIAQRCPDVNCCLFDLPQVIEACEERLLECGISSCSGTFFESVPSADAHILSNVIHDWPDEEAIQILENVRRVGRPGARLFLLEMILDGDTEPLLARSTDLNMLVLTGGRERSRNAFDNLLARAGFSVVRVEPIAELTCLLEAVPLVGSQGVSTS